MPLDDTSSQLSAAFISRAGRLRTGSTFVRSVLLVGGALIAGVAQFAEFPSTGATAWQIAGILATGLVAVGALYSALTEEDASTELALARKAVEEARDAQDQLRDFDDLAREFGKAVELYQSMSVMRGAIERAISTPGMDEEKFVSAILEAAGRVLPIAMGFNQADQWTIGLYRAEPRADGKTVLRCIASKRAIPSDLNQTRAWEAGTGIAGSAFANRDEIVVPDLQSAGLRAVFGTSANINKETDFDRYRSMAAVPILVDGLSEPWGVATATNDQVDHFLPDEGYGVAPVEAVRALAAMAALAVASHRGGAGTRP